MKIVSKIVENWFLFCFLKGFISLLLIFQQIEDSQLIHRIYCQTKIDVESWKAIIAITSFQSAKF